MFLDGGVGALSKVIKAYMGEVVWLPNPPKAERHNLHEHCPNMGMVA